MSSSRKSAASSSSKPSRSSNSAGGGRARRFLPDLVKVDGTRFYRVPSGPFRKPEDVVRAFGYELLNELDRGGFGVVYVAFDQRKKIKVACKELIISAHRRHELEENKNELLVLEKVRHPYVIRLYCHFVVESEATHRMYIFMALADGGNLFRYLKQLRSEGSILAERQYQLYFAQILCGINHMHNVGIAHRDIKLQNVLLCSDTRSVTGDFVLVVTDFGLSVQVDPDRAQLTYCGTPIYMAPEIIEHKPYSGFAADMWALGITLFMLITLTTPFDFNLPEQIVLDHMKQGRINFSLGQFSDTLQDLVRRLLDPNSATRLAMKRATAHPWVAQAYKMTRSKIPVLKRPPPGGPK